MKVWEETFLGMWKGINTENRTVVLGNGMLAFSLLDHRVEKDRWKDDIGKGSWCKVNERSCAHCKQALMAHGVK